MVDSGILAYLTFICDLKRSARKLRITVSTGPVNQAGCKRVFYLVRNTTEV